MLKDLVAIVDNGEAARSLIQRATAFAAAQDAHLAISLMMDIFDNAAVLPPFDYYPVILDRIDEEEQRRTEAVKAAVKDEAVPVEVRPVADALAYLGGASRVEGRYADLLLIGGASAFENQKLRRRSLQAAVTGSGGPVLCLPDNAKLERVDRAVLGWDASKEARRAARDLIDVVNPGAVIDIVCVDPESTAEGHGPVPGSDIARHLARHGFKVDVHVLSAAGRRISTVLQRFAAENGADLLAIGAFAHSRMRDILLGGVTRDLIDDASLPVLLSR
ncbi:universal stress protein [Novosphingobium sp. H3SJ31-1]|uniref:Universal stress protein n=2 Tax=Novosphingobium album (ex Liu et al. 2023) TaxID=3031130 RepID=A0ABT5WXK0_9SPHN|nr:universal stress protein [Novosphingobium album (ex Liu et al. 2023)]